MSGIHSDEEEATARPFVAWFGRAQGRLGFVELVDLGGQNEIALRQTVDLVRPGRDLDFSPGKEDVWVVPLLLRELAYLVDKLERFMKVGNVKVFVMWCSSITFHLSTCFSTVASSSPLSGGTPPRQGTHVLAARSDILGMILPSARGGQV